jgi:hypothetical protein
MRTWKAALTAIATALSAGQASAGEVAIVGARAVAEGPGRYAFEVTLAHEDSGWQHYADRWQVLAPDGTVLGTRELLHPHENEQPFTRSLTGVAVPAGVAEVTIRAHDSVHGDSSDTLTLGLARRGGGASGAD